jgi:hypothetical protein
MWLFSQWPQTPESPAVSRRSRSSWTAAGIIETLSDPKPICVEHIPGAERYGYTVHRKGGNGPDSAKNSELYGA